MLIIHLISHICMQVKLQYIAMSHQSVLLDTRQVINVFAHR